jgi:rhodanese-related sulfurtransferase
MKHSPAFLNLVNSIRKSVVESNLEGLLSRKDQPDPFVLVDVREESEFQAGHIPDAIWMGKGIIERDIEGQIPEKDTEIWLYCGGGFRSVLAADNLQKMGYTNVVSVDGGFRAWLESGSPVVTPDLKR